MNTPKKKIVKKESKIVLPQAHKVAIEEIASDPLFTITVQIEHMTYEGEGDTALKALQAVPVPANDLISSGSVLIEHGENYKEMFFNSVQMKRLLNPYNMEVLINDLAAGLDA
jgi:hypothetical protein